MNAKIGYVKLHRSLVDSEVYSLPPIYLRVFERLILEANHQDAEIPYRRNGQVEKRLIKRGERLTSIRQISEWVGWYERGVLKNPNPKIIKEVLDYLVIHNMIFIYSQSNRMETHYNIVNYSVYQEKDDTKVTEKKQNRNKIETNKKQNALQNNNDIRMINNDKNDKELKTSVILIPEKETILIPEKEIFDYWNTKKGVIHSREEGFEKDKIATAIKSRGKDKIIIAIDRLDKAVMDSSYYYSNKWNIYKFLKQSNGISNWLDDGQLWNNYNIKGDKDGGIRKDSGTDSKDAKVEPDEGERLHQRAIQKFGQTVQNTECDF